MIDEAKGHGDRNVWFKKLVFETNRKKHEMFRTFKEKVRLLSLIPGNEVRACRGFI
jgi:hypothetical protein